ncbi:TetR family transcriptional regulator [Cnuibacter physcomitrellae]|nr:helix-turn-helix domain-containing protein [Cnuibacter physcomitrellae]GGI39048.1 TetR family transcriptional regulator [Cnuibacter physcomitrellae]
MSAAPERVPTRVAAAQRTRTSILEAAAALFSEHGYGATTLKAIAERAGVSVETVGLAGPKRRLLRAAFDMAFAGSSSAFPAGGEPAYVALTEQLAFEEAVGEYLRVLGSSIARTAGLWSAFQAAADADAGAAALFEEVRQVRRTEFRRTAQWLADRGVISGEQVPGVVQEFFLIASHETYLLLRAECGCTPETFTTFLQARVTRLLGELRA